VHYLPGACTGGGLGLGGLGGGGCITSPEPILVVG